ncbi:MAG: DNRLRE domain-containing protein [Kiritimatiellae bacterium]|jgi:hypothetical protein|nr:DNRLRE domain-containing protein [Kiritimatiellia bacterium]
MKQTIRTSWIATVLLTLSAYGGTALTFTNELDYAADYGPITVLPGATASNPSFGTSDIGGTPNEIQIRTIITSAGVAYFSFESAATCDPVNFGGISTVDWSTDIKKDGSYAGDVILVPALWQNETLYMYIGNEVVGGESTDFFRNTATTYLTTAIMDAKSSDFEKYDLTNVFSTHSGDNPDFSDKGSAITLGYITSVGTGGSAGVDRRSKITNGKITINDFYPLNISTGFGNGADAQTEEYVKDANYGSSVSLGARWAPTTPRQSHIVLRFDLSQANKATITNASLNLIKYRDDSQGHMDLYGVINGQPGDALQDWSEETLTYNNAPWLEQDTSVPYDDTDLITSSVVEIDEAFPTTGVEGDIKSSQSEDLLTFIQSDTNGLVTFILTREDTIENGVEVFASKEAMGLESDAGTDPEGTFAPKLVLGLKFVVKGTIILIE